MRACLLLVAAALLSAACTLNTGVKKPSAPAAVPAAAASKPAFNAAAQKKAYDRGMAAFSEEHYEDARKAWQEAARMGPETAVGKKAQENLAKVEAILRSLRSIEGKK